MMKDKFTWKLWWKYVISGWPLYALLIITPFFDLYLTLVVFVFGCYIAKQNDKEWKERIDFTDIHKSTTFQDGFTYEEPKVTVDNKGNIKMS